MQENMHGKDAIGINYAVSEDSTGGKRHTKTQDEGTLKVTIFAPLNSPKPSFTGIQAHVWDVRLMSLHQGGQAPPVRAGRHPPDGH